MKQLSQVTLNLKKIFQGYITPRSVGVDIGSAGLKMVELIPDSFIIRKYTIKPFAKNMVHAGVINDIESVADIIKNQWQIFNPQASHVAIAIPYNSVIIREVVTPIFKSRFALDNYVLSELVRDLDNEDIDFDYTISEQHETGQTLSVVVAKKEKIEEYQAIIQMTGIKVAAIDIEPFAIQYLFNLLLTRAQRKQQIIVLDIGLTRVRAYVFQEYEGIYFTEINVNYLVYLEDILSAHAPELRLKEITDLSAQAMAILAELNLKPQEWFKQISQDVSKLIQSLRSNLLVDKKIRLAEDTQIIIMGGSAALPGLIDELTAALNCQVQEASDLIAAENKNIAKCDLLRLFTALALATWGQQIGKN
jgi:type IV pilus assembly protein PilM